MSISPGLAKSLNRPMVMWGENVRFSGGIPIKRSSVSISFTRLSRASECNNPTHMILGRFQFGNAPFPLKVKSKGICLNPIVFNCFSIDSTCLGIISPRNFNVRWIFSGFTHLTIGGSIFLYSLIFCASLDKIWLGRSMAIKHRIFYVIPLFPRNSLNYWLVDVLVRIICFFDNLINYTTYLKYGIKKIPCCVRDVAYKFWANTLKHGFLSYWRDAIGLSQGGTDEAEPVLRKQVQNRAAHGMAGICY